MEVVFTTGGLEAKLVETGKHEVTSEGADFLLLNVVFLVGLEVRGGESKVDDGDGAVLEATLSLVEVGALGEVGELVVVADQDVVQFEVVIDVARVVDLLDDPEQLHAQVDDADSAHGEVLGVEVL
jgi:hypothetical protein